MIKELIPISYQINKVFVLIGSAVCDCGSS